MKHLALLTLLLCFTLKSYSQDYLDDRTMKLTEVSADKTYGYELKNPVKVGGNEKADAAYLNALKFPSGERIHIADMKFNYKDEQGLEMVVLAFEGLRERKTIFISINGEPENLKAPLGFLFKTPDDLPKVKVFPSDSILKVKKCADITYAVEDGMLQESLGGRNSKPDKAPDFTGGIDELKKYFVANPLTDKKAKQLIFRVSILFLVNCEGKAGNFQIITQGRGDLATYANQVLSIVNKMPQNWKPATKGGKAVDCYQVASFTVMEGALDVVSYRK